MSTRQTWPTVFTMQRRWAALQGDFSRLTVTLLPHHARARARAHDSSIKSVLLHEAPIMKSVPHQ